MIYYWADCPGSLFRLIPIIGDLFRCSCRAASLYNHCSAVRYGSYTLSVSRKLPMYRSFYFARSLFVRPGTETIYRHGAGNIHGPRTDNTAVTSVRSHRAGRSVTSWTVPTDTYHLPRDVDLFDPPRQKGPYPSGDGHY